MEWRKFYTRKWIYGSIRLSAPEIRGTFADLIALAGESKLGDGTLRHDVGKPMQREWIASVLMIPVELLDRTIEDGQKDVNVKDGKGRIQVWDDGTIQLTNFSEYQAGNIDQTPVEAPKKLTQEEIDKMTVRNAVRNPALAHKAEQINGNTVVTPDNKIIRPEDLNG